MGNSSVFNTNKNTFVEQLKIHSNNELNVLGTYLNPAEFPTSGLLIVSNKCK
jgi:hypothetical protein